MYNERIKRAELQSRIITATQAAALFRDQMVVASSGFTKAGDSKAVLKALAARAQEDPLQITLLTGASLGHGTDGILTTAHVLKKRMPFQVDPILRQSINDGEVLFIDQHLGESAELIHEKVIPKVDIAVIEALMLEEDGSIVPTTSVGNSPAFAAAADKIIVEINMSVPVSLHGIHDIFMAGNWPNRQIIPVTDAGTRIGSHAIKIDPEKIAGIVLTETTDSPAQINERDDKTRAIAGHLLTFFEREIRLGRLTHRLRPLQSGIGKVANAVMEGFIDGNFHDLTMYSEVMQDSTFSLIDAGKLLLGSASSITVSEACYHRVFNNFEKYKPHIVLRPQDISNAAEVIRRLGVISINTAIECDIYGNVNSTHIGGTHMMNGIGGSNDFARNAYLSIFVTQSSSKAGAISHIVPMASHIDNTEHDVDIIVTENGLADLRGLAPRERAKLIIANCAHASYRDELNDYFSNACKTGGHTPHRLQEALSWHTRFKDNGTMLRTVPL
ncbi:succinate CoA transferase [Chitinophaga nivalis]|uniref:Succinate CoA transferase n=1 Tax=Chitinophaga nivalis TaxID=2991709 RepID=A0ABT3IHW4_9BACT|nr:succinate CoA transferase [Chitinophaga nivalis]MCW3466765.1 succinate CoA transferase [Chitinophaga nivalis]MCW3483544.1 succinate CoA transferase [Chitinophaga nivalis]